MFWGIEKHTVLRNQRPNCKRNCIPQSHPGFLYSMDSSLSSKTPGLVFCKNSSSILTDIVSWFNSQKLFFYFILLRATRRIHCHWSYHAWNISSDLSKFDIFSILPTGSGRQFRQKCILLTATALSSTKLCGSPNVRGTWGDLCLIVLALILSIGTNSRKQKESRKDLDYFNFLRCGKKLPNSNEWCWTGKNVAKRNIRVPQDVEK